MHRQQERCTWGSRNGTHGVLLHSFIIEWWKTFLPFLFLAGQNVEENAYKKWMPQASARWCWLRKKQQRVTAGRGVLVVTRRLTRRGGRRRHPIQRGASASSEDDERYYCSRTATHDEASNLVSRRSHQSDHYFHGNTNWCSCVLPQ